MQIRRRIAAVLVALGGASCLAVPAFAVGVFPDVPSDHPYRAAIEDLAARHIIGGYTDGNFGPDDPVMRQQFAKMVVMTMDLPVTGAEMCPFGDVVAQTGTDPFYPSRYVAVCAQNNITKGKDATHFDPYADISRLQVVTMIVRAADSLLPGTLADSPTDWSGGLSSGDPTHGANLRKAEYNGLLAGLQGLSGSWNGYASASRGECAQMLRNLLSTSTIPTVTAISPTIGAYAGGTTVVISGTSFTGATGVSFGGVPCFSYRVDSDTQITTSSPPPYLAYPGATVDVQVSNARGTSSPVEADRFAYGSPEAPGAPTVTNISPDTGEPGTSVTIVGTGFTDVVAVMFGGVASASYTVDSDTQITAVAPGPYIGGTGIVFVTVINSAGTSPAVLASQYTY